MLEAGQVAPEFTLTAHDGSTVSLADKQGGWVVLWWYPKASTPG